MSLRESHEQSSFILRNNHISFFLGQKRRLLHLGCWLLLGLRLITYFLGQKIQIPHLGRLYLGQLLKRRRRSNYVAENPFTYILNKSDHSSLGKISIFVNKFQRKVSIVKKVLPNGGWKSMEAKGNFGKSVDRDLIHIRVSLAKTRSIESCKGRIS